MPSMVQVGSLTNFLFCVMLCNPSDYTSRLHIRIWCLALWIGKIASDSHLTLAFKVKLFPEKLASVSSVDLAIVHGIHVAYLLTRLDLP